MKRISVIIAAMLLLVGFSVSAMAGGEIRANQITNISAKIENRTGKSVNAAVRLVAYDSAGVAVGHVCKETLLDADQPTTVTFVWRAPSYPTGLYWSSKVEVDGRCANHDDDDSDSDSDSDGDSDDSDD